MLRNGSTFSARMLSAGERVRLRVNEGDIEIRASEIALTGFSLGDLAEQQWALLHQQQLDKQFPFIDWCARHHLYDIADTALAQMAERGQDTPRIAGYQVRVKRLREIHQEQQAAAAQLAAAPQVNAAPQVKAATQQALYQQPTYPQPAAQVPTPQPMAARLTHAQPAPAANMPAAIPASTVPPSVAATPPTLLLPTKAIGPTSASVPALTPSHVIQAAHQPLENPREQSATAKEPAITSPNPATLPSTAIEVFTARVQPWVVSRCGGCHDMNGTNSFKIERYSKQEAVPRATTLKNLAATTRLIDKNNPTESPLLVMAGRAHGTSLVPPVTAGDAAAMAAFREFVMLATGRELPKEIKHDPASTNSLHGLPGQVTPGRATFPASAADEPAPENKAAAVLKQTEAGWQAAIERQRAYDLDAQKLKDLEHSSQRANEARGLIVDPAVKPAANALAAPVLLSPAPATTAHQLPATLLPEPQPQALPSSANPPHAIPPSVVPPNAMMPNPNLSHAMPESLLPKSLAAKPKTDLEAYMIPDETKPSPVLDAGAKPAGLPNSLTPTQQPVPPPVKIDLKKPRRMFPLPPDDTPPPKAVGTGDTKRR
jgi:cytochrome c553